MGYLMNRPASVTGRDFLFTGILRNLVPCLKWALQVELVPAKQQ